jgi:hypothetical protein
MPQLHQVRQYTFATPQRRESHRLSLHFVTALYWALHYAHRKIRALTTLICCARSTWLPAQTCSASPRQRLVVAICDLQTLLATNEWSSGARRDDRRFRGFECQRDPLTKSQPPVTLMCRDTAGRCECRSMMKSCPLGLRVIADLIAALRTSSLSDWRNGERRSAASSWPRHM